jgi:arginine exporter protein ArgO
MTAAVLAGLLAGYGVAVPVGAIAALIVSLTSRTSLKVGVGAALGVATADGLYCTAAVLGGAALAQFVEPVAGPMRWVAMVILVGIAVKTAWTALRHRREAATARREATTGRMETPVGAYLTFLGLTLLNPATIIYFTALVLGRHSAAEHQVVWVLAAFLASASWQLVIAASGSLLGRILTGPKGRLVTALASSGVIAVLAVSLVVS